ncbi:MULTISPECIES: imidazolonepropionase [unclassified Hyphomonas]|jgi:imidazolonepropionase|uniref:imidazolonepropionase n=2 Tax=Hyphomonas TaxID=85 RepID=UPI000E8B60F6|nr:MULTISPECIES: imidazolonepropionase [unclassified Hyphomonas]MDF1804725.1 imidazolonepropionase [Hyphomonas sp.]HBJ42105.1 imidazolonepropionase [Hyphomonas sp.]HBU32496.1 imidazolonepropionase [Hyphomonas sp.]HBX94318.1 imidazolonepropionase [Hyphomonas sp.]
MTRPTLFTDCTVATMESGRPSYGLIEDAAILQRDGLIEWVGRSGAVPGKRSEMAEQSLQGRLVTPALIDCHTHLVFGGNRAKEFEQRLQGVSYEEIARSGGGINSTVESTRTASFEALVSASLRRLDDLISDGVAVVEVKSGYGLTIEDEIRMLRVARKLEALRPVKIVTTWLAAHALPPAFKDRPDNYIDEVAIPGLVRAAEEGLVDAVDGFCETIGFSPAQIERVFQAAASLGLPVKLHAEQISDLKGALLAARYSALSADHLEFLSETDVPEFARAGTVAVLLPGAFYTLRETKLPPIAALRKHGVDIAIATDCNPGSSPLSSLLAAMNMACIQFSLTPEEALAGTTRNAAKALGLAGMYGEITQGAKTELAVWDVAHPADLSYWIGRSTLHMRLSNRNYM